MRNARIRIEDVLLDRQNPRHDPVTGTREAVQALLADDGADKLVNLATDIAEHGVSPIDLYMVMPNEQGLFTVLEGNRRLAALKLLTNPALAAGHQSEKRFRIAAVNADPPDEINCVIASSREEARHWLELRHTGEKDGRGVVPWSAEAQNRFSRKPGTHIDKAMMFVDTITQTYNKNKSILDSVESIRKKRMTTLGRLVSDPYVRQVMGIDIIEGELLSRYNLADMEPVVEKLLEDLAGDVTVSSLKNTNLRKKYIDRWAPQALSEARFEESPVPFKSARITGGRRRKPKQKKKSRKTQEKRLLDGLSLQNLGSRIANILQELQKLDVDSFPNAASVLLRAILELSVQQFHSEKGWKVSQDLKSQVRKCLRAVDPSEQDPRFQPVRTGLQDGTSLLAVATLHGYVHNRHYHPTGTELRTIAANYEAFLQSLDELV